MKTRWSSPSLACDVATAHLSPRRRRTTTRGAAAARRRRRASVGASRPLRATSHDQRRCGRRVLEALALPCPRARRRSAPPSTSLPSPTAPGRCTRNPRGERRRRWTNGVSFVRQSRTEPRQSIRSTPSSPSSCPKRACRCSPSTQRASTASFQEVRQRGEAPRPPHRRARPRRTSAKVGGRARWRRRCRRSATRGTRASGPGTAATAASSRRRAASAGAIASQPDGGRWSNLICSHRADVLAIFRNDTARRVKTSAGAPEGVRREREA